MGLLQAGIGALGSVLADQWREYFYCDSLGANVLVERGAKRVNGKRSSNTKGDDNIISNGSIIAVADGQCMMIVEQGKVVDISAVPGEFVYDSSTEPSIFYGNLGESILGTFKTLGKRFTFGGDTAKDQRVYYFNTKEIIGNKYGTPNAVPFRVLDKNIGLDIDIAVRCHGEYSYKLVNPMLFYTNVCGNVTGGYGRENLDSQLKSELLSALQPAFAKISEMGIRYSALPGHTLELRDSLNQVLVSSWTETRGIALGQLAVSSIKASEEDEALIKEAQRNAMYRNPTMAAATLVGAQAQAMQDAAKNEGQGGAFMAFAGMNMAQNAGGMNAQSLYNMGQQQPAQPEPAAPPADTWRCTCGASCTGRFCTDCGSARPEPKVGWKCSCGKVNNGRFCSECGAKKPAGEKAYKCDKCGWEPEDKQHPPKFCPECGDLFDDNDAV